MIVVCACLLFLGPHCGAYYSNYAVIGIPTCQTATSLGRARCRIVTRPLFHEGGVWAQNYSGKSPSRRQAVKFLKCAFDFGTVQVVHFESSDKHDLLKCRFADLQKHSCEKHVNGWGYCTQGLGMKP